MSREIKFRAWVDNAYMYYNDNPRNVFPIDVDDKKDPIMQYTGLKDRNGNEIYEGDIVSCYKNCRCMCSDKECKGSDSTVINRVIFSTEDRYGNVDASFKLSDKYNDIDYFDSYDSFEVIGNIWENGELLEATND